MTELETFITSNSECTLDTSQLPADADYEWIVTESNLPYVPLYIPAQWPMLASEAERATYHEHRDNDSSGWSSVCIHGISQSHTDHYEVYTEYRNLSSRNVPYDWTDIDAPYTKFWLQEYFPYDVYHRVRFMKVKPGGYILPHTDGNQYSLNAVNIGIWNPNGCKLVVKDRGTVPFNHTGSVFLFANNFEHAVFNDSEQDRYHMIIHGYPDDYRASERFRNLVVEGYRSLLPGIHQV